MLTGDLVRVTTRKGRIGPRWIDPADEGLLRLAQRLIRAFERGVGRPRAALEEAVEDVTCDDLLLRRGLSKLLEDRATFEVDAPRPPEEIRAAVFALSARVHPVTLGPGADDLLLWSDGGLAAPELVPDVLPVGGELPGGRESDAQGEPPPGPPRPRWTHRSAVLKRAGELLGMSPEAVLEALYADLEDAHVLRSVDVPTPADLLSAYNLSLAQAVLLRATELVVDLEGAPPARRRALFRALKFHRLMHRIEDRGRGKLRVTVDGPLSLFSASSRYGLQMALFLPALVRAEGWRLEATLAWGPRREPRSFILDPGAGLRAAGPDPGVYRTQEERWFVERFEALDTPWRLDLDPPILPGPGQELVVPDVALRHPDGRVAYLEILGFWRRGSLLGRLEQLRAARMDHLILAVSKNMRASVEELGEVPAEVVYFKEIIAPREVVARAERVARREPGGPVVRSDQSQEG